MESLRRIEECSDRPIQQHMKKDEGGKLIGGVRGKDRERERERGNEGLGGGLRYAKGSKEGERRKVNSARS